MKRQACTNTSNVIKDRKRDIVNITNTLCASETLLDCSFHDIVLCDLDEYLEPLLFRSKTNYLQMASQAVELCFNSSATDCGAENFKRATAIVKLQAIIKGASASADECSECVDWSYTIPNNCKPANGGNMEQIFCWASEYTKKVLDATSESCTSTR